MAVTVSAVVPTRNRARRTLRAVRSILAQSRPVDELVVVDDGSSDDTVAVLRRELPQLRVLRQEHAGVSAARNHGIRETRGRWIAFLDSDDEWLPTKIDRQLAAIASTDGAVLCHTDEIWMRGGRQVNPGRRHAKDGEDLFVRSLELCLISPSSVMLRRSLLDEVGMFDESLPACEDYDLWLRVLRRHPALFVDEPLLVKNGGHADQLSRQAGLDRYRVRALRRLLESGGLAWERRSAAKRALVEKLTVYLNGARRRGRSDEVARLEERYARYLREADPGKETRSLARSCGSRGQGPRKAMS